MNAEELQVILDASSLYWSTHSIRGSIADLRRANLRRANLREVDLREANLREANLVEADLAKANLSGTYLGEADLCRANLRGANLSGANLYGADLRGASLRKANLSGADLRWANLCEADFREANLDGVRLTGAIGNMQEICSMQIKEYPIVYTSSQLVVGCQQHPIKEWKDPSFLCHPDRELWNKYSPLIWMVLEKCPAMPYRISAD